ncbi:MAG: hypothetical protein OEY59_00400 [Deltaproteobacteria bacterium]|nr:hypothetical protein [Deltaproteobacteria bacterium]
MISLRYLFEFAVFKFLLGTVNIFPELWVAGMGRSFGSLCYQLGIRKAVVKKNLEIAFKGKLSNQEEEDLIKKIYRNIGSVLFEVLLLNFINPKQLHQYLEFEGREIFQNALAEGKGVVMAGSHFGHWELLSAGINTFIHPFYGYAGKQKNSLFDDSLNKIRQRFGMNTISKSKTATKEMMRALKDKQILGILGDLNVPHDNLFVDFFGKKAAMGTGLAIFTIKREAPLIFTSIVRTGPLTHRGIIKRIDYELTGDTEKDVQNVAQKISDEIENNIRQYPDHYFWVNRRWKTRPPEEKDQPVY